MPYEFFVHTDFRAPALRRIRQANEIIEEYRRQGFTLTLRQLYYQFVARDLIENKEREYKNLGTLISKARLAGQIDWNAIEDRTRNLRALPHWDSPSDIVESCAAQFRIDLWEGQQIRPEVWIEKEALVGVIAGVCNELDVAYFACRGYVSQSEQWRAGRRAEQRLKEHDQRTLILHLGDHDPSGVDMTRDNDDRLRMFSSFSDAVEVKRIALNMSQIEQYDPPPNPAKVTDSRADDYIARFGDSSWELDALEPAVLVGLIRREVAAVTDNALMGERETLQEDGRRRLEEVAAEMQEND